MSLPGPLGLPVESSAPDYSTGPSVMCHPHPGASRGPWQPPASTFGTPQACHPQRGPVGDAAGPPGHHQPPPPGWTHHPPAGTWPDTEAFVRGHMASVQLGSRPAPAAMLLRVEEARVQVGGSGDSPLTCGRACGGVSQAANICGPPVLGGSPRTGWPPWGSGPLDGRPSCRPCFPGPGLSSHVVLPAWVKGSAR